MYKLCIIGLSIIFILSINGVLSHYLSNSCEGSWVFTKDSALQHHIFDSGADYDELNDEIRLTVKSEVTPVTPLEAVWYPKLQYQGRSPFLAYSFFYVLKLHQFEGNELSLIGGSVKANHTKQVGMLLCKKSDGECGRDYKGQVSYVDDGDEIGIFIIKKSHLLVEVYYFINNVKVGNPETVFLRSHKPVLPAVTFTKPGVVEMMECPEEPPAQLLIDIGLMEGRNPVMDFNTLMDYYKSKKPNDSEVFDFKKYQKNWMFRDDFIVCKSHADQSKVPELSESKERRMYLQIVKTHRSIQKITFHFLFGVVNRFTTTIKKDLANNTWSKFTPVMSTRMVGFPDMQLLEDWLIQFLTSANIIFLGPEDKSLHIADDTCAIHLEHRF